MKFQFRQISETKFRKMPFRIAGDRAGRADAARGAGTIPGILRCRPL